MADLATLEELGTLLGLSEAQVELREDLLSLLLDGSETLFESDAHRSRVPFAGAVTGRIERHRAEGGLILLLDYPVDAVESIVLGLDPANPTEDLDPDDPEVVYVQPGSRELIRTDGGSWHVGDWCRPCFVEVTYNTRADLPEDAKAAVLRLAAAMYGERAGRVAGVKSESLANYSVTYIDQSEFAQAARQDPAWDIAIAEHRRIIAV